MRRNYARKTRIGGNYRERKSTLSELTVKDLVNPWNFTLYLARRIPLFFSGSGKTVCWPGH